MRVAIVGSGVAGGAAAVGADRSGPTVDLTMLERASRVGGRAATGTHGACTYDYGANYLKPESERIETFVRALVPDDRRAVIDEPVHTFDRRGDVTPGREDPSEKWSYRDGIGELPTAMVATASATVHRETSVESIRRRGDRWAIVDATGTERGPFDAVVMTPPPSATAAILEPSDWVTRRWPSLGDRLREVRFRCVLSGVFQYEDPIDAPYYGAVNTDKEHAIGWVSREECKPGHVPAGESVLIVQANHEWSLAHVDGADDAILNELAAKTASLLDREAVGDPSWSTLYRWRNAIPEEEPPAAVPLEELERHGLYCVGDWTTGEGRLARAIESGLDAVDRLWDYH